MKTGKLRIAGVCLFAVLVQMAVCAADINVYVDTGQIYLEKYNQTKNIKAKKEYLKNAEDNFRKALKINAGEGRAYAGLARVYTRYSLFTPKPIFPFSLLPKIWTNSKEEKLLRQAAEYGEKAVRYAPSYIESYLCIAEAALQSCSASETDRYLGVAFKNLAAAKDLNEKNPEVYNLYGWAYLTQYYFDGDLASFDSALLNLEKAYQLYPSESEHAKSLERTIFYLKTCNSLKVFKFLLQLS